MVDEASKEVKLTKELLFEPNPAEVLDKIVPMYIKSLVYSTSLRAKTSEFASRRMAMENATDNAREMLTSLDLFYNRARQAAITNEIIEIVESIEIN